jgi:glycosyltransferase involved in cell wall biosynthesis
MNILILNWRDVKHPEAGGAEVHLHSLFGYLVKWGHAVTLLTTRFKGGGAMETIDGITVLRQGRTFTFNWEAPLLIRRLLRNQTFDCIIDDVNKIPFFTPRWFPKQATGVFFHHLFGRTVFELAAWPMALYVNRLEGLAGWGYRRVPCCTVSKSTAAELIGAGFDENSITIIENSVDTDIYRPDSGIVKEPDLLLYAGRIKRYKNIGLAIECIASLNTQGRRLRLVVAGSGDDEGRLKGLARQLDIEAQIDFRGYIDEQTKIDLYRRAILFVNPSHKEGWGITSIEANACGTAVVANNAPGLRDSVRHGETGLLYRENDAADFARCIVELIDNNDLRRTMECAGREWALRFSWEQSARRVEEWLAIVAHKGRTG